MITIHLNIIDQNGCSLFERFNSRFGGALGTICPQLLKFNIDFYAVDEFDRDSHGYPPINDIHRDAFAYSLYQEVDNRAESTHACIVYNTEIINYLGLTEEEQFAAIAHEVGHIILWFRDNSDNQYQGIQGKEIYADKIACQIGLSKQLLSTLTKIEKSGLYQDCKTRFGMRKLMIGTYDI